MVYKGNHTKVAVVLREVKALKSYVFPNDFILVHLNMHLTIDSKKIGIIGSEIASNKTNIKLEFRCCRCLGTWNELNSIIQRNPFLRLSFESLISDKGEGVTKEHRVQESGHYAQTQMVWGQWKATAKPASMKSVECITTNSLTTTNLCNWNISNRELTRDKL